MKDAHLFVSENEVAKRKPFSSRDSFPARGRVPAERGLDNGTTECCKPPASEVANAMKGANAQNLKVTRKLPYWLLHV